jgi:ubiquinone/menaquinone biosynthesis C-methylase UbiE
MASMVTKFLKRLLDNRFYWNIVEGPLYNVLIYRVLDGFYGDFFRTLTIPRKAQILDIGAGAGQATLKLAAQHPEASVYGIDYAVTQVFIARYLRRYRRIRNVEFRIAHARRIPFCDETFDIVVSLASLKHWLDVTEVIAEIYRVLKTEGVAHIVECDADAKRHEIEMIAEGASRLFLLNRTIAWYQEHVVFGQSAARDEVSLCAHQAGFNKVLVKRMKGLPFFQMTLQK